MNKTIKSIVVLAVMFNFNPVKADMFGGDVMQLSNIYAQLKKEYDAIMKQVKEAKAANDTMREIYEVSGQVYDEYKFINNFSTENEIKRIQRDIKGLTGLDRLSEVDNEGKFRILRNEINRRFKNDDPKKQEVINRISEMERLEALKQKKLEEAANAGAGTLNDKNLSSSIASSNALLSALAISKQQEELKKEINKTEFASEMKHHEDGFINFLDKNKD